MTRPNGRVFCVCLRHSERIGDAILWLPEHTVIMEDAAESRGREMPDNQVQLSRRTVLQLTAMVGAGLAAGAIARSGPDHTAAGAASPGAVAATATRKSELQELNQLRTRVAEQHVCTSVATATEPAPSPTATQAPLASTGEPLPYLDVWTITVLGISPTPGSPDSPPAGQFMQVNLTVSHSANSAQILPYQDFILTDDAGRFSVLDAGINSSLLGNVWLVAVGPGVTENRAWIFDVPVDAGDTFILESSADPALRVALEIEQRG